MAEMYPEQIPLAISKDPRRSAEIKVYRKLGECLTDEWLVIYSAVFHKYDEKGREKIGECDFIIAHPTHGILFLEIKGGRICYIPEKDQWTSTDRHGSTRNIKDPFKQAEDALFHIMKTILQGKYRKYRYRSGVIFTDSNLDQKMEYLNGRPRGVLCEESEFTNNFYTWLMSRLSQHPTTDGKGYEKPLGQQGINRLQEIYCQPVTLALSRANLIENHMERVKIITSPLQKQILETTNESLWVNGGAGTGKSLLAVEIFNRTPSSSRICLLCFNKPLADSYDLKMRNNSFCGTFHKLIKDLTGKENIPENEMNYSISKAIDKLRNSELYDLVIVDEGQDFQDEWWKLVLNLVKPDSRLVIFYDKNQSVYSNPKSLLPNCNLKEVNLRENYRNAIPIGEVGRDLYEGYDVELIGPDLPRNQTLEVISLIPGKNISEFILQLVGEIKKKEAINLGFIAILCEGSEQVGELKRSFVEKSYEVRPAGSFEDNQISIDTVRRHKGLEYPYVILVTNQNLEAHRELCYVGVTRAQIKLFVVKTQPNRGDSHLNKVLGKLAH